VRERVRVRREERVRGEKGERVRERREGERIRE
jgi:hypothetical protein